MIALTSTVAPTLAGQAFAAVKVAVAHVGRRLADAWSHRHDAATLAALDDRMLADIGLTRGDIRDALSEPLWRDPTSVLERRRGERRRARRAAVRALVAQQSRAPSPSLVPGPDAFMFPPSDPPVRLKL